MLDTLTRSTHGDHANVINISEVIMVRFISRALAALKQHVLGETAVEHSTRPARASWLDCWSQADGNGRTFCVRVGRTTWIWSSPSALRRAT